MNQQATTTDELVFTRPRGEQEQQILTAEAVEFLTELVTRFTPKRNKLLAARIQQQQDIIKFCKCNTFWTVTASR